MQTDHPVVALTFDDGPHTSWTPRVLDLLEKHRAAATFFVIGREAERQPEIIQRMVASGHAVGNHTWDHPCLPLLTGVERRRQLRACDRVLAPHLDPRSMRMFRPPYLDQSLGSRLDALACGYKVIASNLHAFDWENRGRLFMRQRLESGLRPGCIVLLHDTLAGKPHVDRSDMLNVLDTVLTVWARNYKFVTVPKLLTLGKPVTRIWLKHRRAGRA